MIERIDLFHLPFYKKENFTGSDRGLRFWIGKAEVETETVFQVIVWPEPLALQYTEDEKKYSKNFPFSEEGLDEIYKWLLGAAREWIEDLG